MIALLAGTALGQGAMLLTSFVLLYTNNTYAGVLTTAIGIHALLVVLVDWGGLVIQRQVGTELRLTNPVEFAVARLPALFAVVAALVCFPSEWVGGAEVRTFLWASVPGLVVSTLNMSGLLDVSASEVRHGLLSGVNYFGIAVYVLIGWGFELELSLTFAGWINSCLLASFAVLTFYLATRGTEFNRGDFCASRVGCYITQGLLVSASVLPGQLISRMVAVVLLTSAADREAASFNFLKSFSGVYAQWVAFLRRAEYRDAAAAARLRPISRGSLLLSQRRSILGGLAALAISGLALLLGGQRLGIGLLLTGAFVLHGALWLLSSSYLNGFQLRQMNWAPASHAMLTLLLAVSLLHLVQVGFAYEALAVELSASFCAFVLVMSGARHFDRIGRG